MPNDVAHFAIHAADCDRARRFYERVFGWRFEPWGPPNFWMIETSPGAIGGALQQRNEPLEGAGMRGFECTISVRDVDAVADAVVAAGGMIVAPRYDIAGVGALVRCEDPEGNVFGAMQYETSAAS